MDFINEQSAEKIGQRHQAVNNNIIRGGLKAPAKIALSASNLLIQKILDRFAKSIFSAISSMRLTIISPLIKNKAVCPSKEYSIKGGS